MNWIDPWGLKVYRCCREVQVNRFVDKAAKLFGYKHCFIKTDTKEAGMGPAQGGPLPTFPVGIRTKVTDHTGQAPCATCEEFLDVDEDCVNQELEIGKNTGRWWPWNECNDFVDEILEKCHKKEKCGQGEKPELGDFSHLAPGP